MQQQQGFSSRNSRNNAKRLADGIEMTCRQLKCQILTVAGVVLGNNADGADRNSTISSRSHSACVLIAYASTLYVSLLCDSADEVAASDHCHQFK